jgi:hypothetical protein
MVPLATILKFWLVKSTPAAVSWAPDLKVDPSMVRICLLTEMASQPTAVGEVMAPEAKRWA